jgi:hypothetical protein
MTSASALADVVELGGLALQAEDCLVKAAVRHRGEHGGLVRMENERYHQFIIWRAVLPLWHAELERDDNSDLVLRSENEVHYFELKNWRGRYGETQVRQMQNDVDRKLRRRANGYLVVTSMNPESSTKTAVEYLTSTLTGLQTGTWLHYQFPTEGRDGAPIMFWIAGWPVERNL